jgi:flavin reductase (DIM6/NTAB) family NADH-FMN oxidoreductase RutF
MTRLEPSEWDPMQLRQAYGCFPSGVSAVCALDGDEPVGIAASSFTSVSVDPGLVAVCIQNTSTTWPRLRRLRRIGISVLSEKHNREGRALALKNGDRFADVEWSPSDEGAVFIHGAVAWLECSIHSELPAGDHAIVLLAIHALHAEPDRPPLVFHGSRFRRLLPV